MPCWCTLFLSTEPQQVFWTSLHGSALRQAQSPTPSSAFAVPLVLLLEAFHRASFSCPVPLCQTKMATKTMIRAMYGSWRVQTEASLFPLTFWSSLPFLSAYEHLWAASSHTHLFLHYRPIFALPLGRTQLGNYHLLVRSHWNRCRPLLGQRRIFRRSRSLGKVCLHLSDYPLLQSAILLWRSSKAWLEPSCKTGQCDPMTHRIPSIPGKKCFSVVSLIIIFIAPGCWNPELHATEDLPWFYLIRVWKRKVGWGGWVRCTCLSVRRRILRTNHVFAPTNGNSSLRSANLSSE